MEFFMANREGIIKIDRNVETVNCKGRRPHQWMEFTQANPDLTTESRISQYRYSTGAKENSFVFVQSKKTPEIIPVKYIVPCKHICKSKWKLHRGLPFISEQWKDF